MCVRPPSANVELRAIRRTGVREPLILRIVLRWRVLHHTLERRVALIAKLAFVVPLFCLSILEELLLFVYLAHQARQAGLRVRPKKINLKNLRDVTIAVEYLLFEDHFLADVDDVPSVVY